MNYLDRLKELGEKAMKGPWGITYDGSSTWSVGAAHDPQEEQVCSIYDRGTDCFDGKFIATSRNLWPEIMAVIEAADKVGFRGSQEMQEIPQNLFRALDALRQKVEEKK